ncbi:MAG: hypothetical protein NTW96_08375 [Planctomycetia bacterium]|nr:hypothetical protein [Planctomycetia bacterium]
MTAPIQTLVNMAASPAVAYDVHGRLARACWRFLGMTIASAGHLATDREVVLAGNAGEPVALAVASQVAGEFRQLARTVATSAGGELRSPSVAGQLVATA